MSFICNELKWFVGFDGFFFFRILDYMYLGNFGYVNNLDLFKFFGIG